MNYGYAELNGTELDLQGELEKDRYFIQLYHHVAAAVDLNGKKVLEVGCITAVYSINGLVFYQGRRAYLLG